MVGKLPSQSKAEIMCKEVQNAQDSCQEKDKAAEEKISQWGWWYDYLSFC